MSTKLGAYHTLLQLIEQLPSDAELIFVGDLCDKGNFTKEVIEFVISNNHSCVMGNHEKMMLEYVHETDTGWENNIGYGGRKTIESYQGYAEMLESHLGWIKSLPNHLIVDDKFFITHGFGLPYYQRRDQEHYQDVILWNRLSEEYKWRRTYEDYTNYKLINIFGHDTVLEALITTQYCNIDTGAVYGNKLTALGISDMQLYSQKTDPRDISNG